MSLFYLSWIRGILCLERFLWSFQFERLSLRCDWKREDFIVVIRKWKFSLKFSIRVMWSLFSVKKKDWVSVFNKKEGFHSSGLLSLKKERSHWTFLSLKITRNLIEFNSKNFSTQVIESPDRFNKWKISFKFPSGTASLYACCFNKLHSLQSLKQRKGFHWIPY